MTRILINQSPDAKATEMLTGVKKALGMTPNLYATVAHSSAALEFHLSGSAALQKTQLSAALREQLAIVTAGANGCDYCASAHTMLGGMRKVSKDELALNLKGQSGDAKIQAALTFALRVIDTRGHVSDADLNTVRTAGYSEAEIVEIIAVVADNIFTNYFNNVAKTTIDFPLINTGKASVAA